MTTSILALEMIGPIIGGVVLTGAVGFFSGIMLARKDPDELQSDVHFRNGTDIGRKSGNRITESTRSTSVEPSPDLTIRQLFLREETGSTLAALLRWIVPNPATGFAAIVGTGPNEKFPTISTGLSRLSIEQLAIPQVLIERLMIENPLCLDDEPECTNLLRWLDEIDRRKVHRLCVAGLDNGNGIFAVLIASDLWPAGSPEVEQRRLMKFVADYVAGRWYQFLSLEKQSQELRSTRDMLELHSIIDSQSAEPVETLTQFVTRLADMVDADRVAVYFVARRMGEQLQPIVQCGHSYPSDHESAGYRQEQLLAKIAIESEAGQLRESDYLPNLGGLTPIASSVVLPIRINGRVLGALCTIALDDRGSLQKRRRLIEFAAEILSKSLGRVFDEATIRRQARHDHLTDLINRRSLDAHLAEEAERIQSGDSTACSLILADLDRFKSFNDRFGHQFGDKVLRETARVLSQQVSRLRSGEHSIVARYGGEEFAILLPNVGIAGAMRIAEGIRAALESETIRIGESQARVTLSLGVASMPDQALSVDSLIAAADQALYQAKSNGRNCVCCADSFVQAGMPRL